MEPDGQTAFKYNPRPTLSDLIEVQAAILVPGAVCGDELHQGLCKGEEKAGSQCGEEKDGSLCGEEKAGSVCGEEKAGSPSGAEVGNKTPRHVRPRACVDVTVTTLAVQKSEVTASSSLVKVDT